MKQPRRVYANTACLFSYSSKNMWNSFSWLCDEALIKFLLLIRFSCWKLEALQRIWSDNKSRVKKTKLNDSTFVSRCEMLSEIDKLIKYPSRAYHACLTRALGDKKKFFFLTFRRARNEFALCTVSSRVKSYFGHWNSREFFPSRVRKTNERFNWWNVSRNVDLNLLLRIFYLNQRCLIGLTYPAPTTSSRWTIMEWNRWNFSRLWLFCLFAEKDFFRFEVLSEIAAENLCHKLSWALCDGSTIKFAWARWRNPHCDVNPPCDVVMTASLLSWLPGDKTTAVWCNFIFISDFCELLVIRQAENLFLSAPFREPLTLIDCRVPSDAWFI